MSESRKVEKSRRVIPKLQRWITRKNSILKYSPDSIEEVEESHEPQNTALYDTTNKFIDLKLDQNIDNINRATIQSPQSPVEQKTKDNITGEIEVCRIFSDSNSILTPTAPQATSAVTQPTTAIGGTKDTSTAFFDLISNTHSIVGGGTKGILSELGLNQVTSTDGGSGKQYDDGYGARVAIGNEVDRRRDAWIPNEQTRQCLIACMTAPPGTYTPPRDMLTTPGVLLDEDLGDNVMDSMVRCLGEAEATQRNFLTENDVTQDERGLRELVQAGSYRSAINLTARLLAIYGQGRNRSGNVSKHSPHSLQLWFTRIALLVKIKAYDVAESEADAFSQLEKPDVFYQFYPEMYGSRPGSIAPFSFRLLIAELPMHCSKPKESLTRLYSLKATIKQMLENLKQGNCEDGNPLELSDSDRNDSVRLWSGRETRVMHSIVNCALALKDYELAMVIMEELCHRDGAPTCLLYSALGRLHLQVGDVAGAEVCFEEAKRTSNSTLNNNSAPSTNVALKRAQDLRDCVDRGLLAVARNNFDDAYTSFQQASALDPKNIMVLNNMSVCLLYGGHLKEAIAVLESAIASKPVHALQESLLLNLCMLYDMESSRGRMKKFALLRQISKYQADAPTTILEKLYG